MVAGRRTDGGELARGIDGRPTRGRPPGTPSEPLRGCRPDTAAEPAVRRRRDLVPLRCGSPRVPVDRGPRPRRRARRRSAPQRDGRAGRPGHVLLPRRTGMAQLLPLHPGPQHRRGGRPGSVHLRRSVPLDPPRPEHPDRARDGRRRGGHRVVGRARRLPRTDTAASAPSLGPAGAPAPSSGDRRRPRDDGRTSVPPRLPPGPRRRCPDGGGRGRAHVDRGRVREVRHAVAGRGPRLDVGAWCHRPSPRVVLPAFRGETGDVGPRGRGSPAAGPARTR